MTNEDVVRAWMRGKPSSSTHLLTDGHNLYSYEVKIGYTVGNKKVVYGYAASHGRFISRTTSHHVRLALQYADEVEKMKKVKR